MLISETSFGEIVLFLHIKDKQFFDLIGGKNWMHSNTAHGATCSAALYSIVATAQANGLDTEKYLTELFSQQAGTVMMPFNT